MEQAGDKPQAFTVAMRQSALGIIVESAFALREAIKILWPLLVLMVLKPGRIPVVWIWPAGAALLIIIVIAGYLRFRHFVFYIDASSGEFVLESGVFNRKKVIIQLERIQQVNLSQNFVQKLLRVYAVEINTASTAKSEAKIKAVTLSTALQLKEHLLNRAGMHAAPDAGPVAAHADETAMHLGLKTLAKIAITSNYGKSFAIIIAFLAAAYDSFRSFLESKSTKDFFFQSFHFSSVLYTALFFVGVAIIILFLFNLIRVVITFSDYRIIFKKNAFSISYGLFNTRNIVLYTEKIQLVALVTNFFQKKMNLQRIFFHQASSDIGSDKQATVPIPGCTPQQGNELLLRIFDHIPSGQISLQPNIRKMIPGIVFLIVPPSLLLFFANNTAWFNTYLFLLPFWFIIAGAVIYFRFRNCKLKAGNGFVLAESGAWDITTQMMETHKIQAITTKQQLWHRRANVGHITLHTAGGDVTFKYGNFKRINALANQWLYEVETSAKGWM